MFSTLEFKLSFSQLFYFPKKKIRFLNLFALTFEGDPKQTTTTTIINRGVMRALGMNPPSMNILKSQIIGKVQTKIDKSMCKSSFQKKGKHIEIDFDWFTCQKTMDITACLYQWVVFFKSYMKQYHRLAKTIKHEAIPHSHRLLFRISLYIQDKLMALWNCRFSWSL